MSPIQWYYARGDQQAGPVSSAELKQLAISGGLLPDDLVWREGMTEWAEARNVKGLFEGPAPKPSDAQVKRAEPLPEIGEPPAAPPPAAQPRPGLPGIPGRPALDAFRRPAPRHLFDMLLDTIRARFSLRFIKGTSKVFTACGHYGLYAAMAMSFVFGMILGIKSERLDPVLQGVLGVLVLAVLQYVAHRFCGAMERLNRTTSGTMSSAAFLDCFALLSIVVGLVVLLASAFIAIRTDVYVTILWGAAVFVVCEYLACVALSPAALSISVIPEARAGEEAIGVISFLLKAGLRLVPVAFGAGVIYGTLMLAWACYQVFTRLGPLLADLTAFEAKTAIIYSAALPFTAYLLFLIYYLSIDVIRAVLSLPGKLDQLAAKKEDEQRPE